MTARPSAPNATDNLTNGTWAGRWVLDAAASSVRFHSTSMWGLVKVKGRFTDLRGDGSLLPDGTITGSLVLAAASVDTANKRRDKHLRSDHFLDVKTFPEITYTVETINVEDQKRLRVAGALTVLDQTHPLELTATLAEADETGATLSTDAELDRSGWGVDFNKLGAIGMTTRVEARLRLTRH